jgi:hypothetical protein
VPGASARNHRSGAALVCRTELPAPTAIVVLCAERQAELQQAILREPDERGERDVAVLAEFVFRIASAKRIVSEVSRRRCSVVVAEIAVRTGFEPGERGLLVWARAGSLAQRFAAQLRCDQAHLRRRELVPSVTFRHLKAGTVLYAQEDVAEHVFCKSRQRCAHVSRLPRPPTPCPQWCARAPCRSARAPATAARIGGTLRPPSRSGVRETAA